MERQERLELGHRYFVATFFVVLAVELVVSAVVIGAWSLLAGVLVAAVCMVPLLILVNRVYGGVPVAGPALLAWVGLELGLSLFVVVAMTFSSTALGFLRGAGNTALWLALARVAGYA